MNTRHAFLAAAAAAPLTGVPAASVASTDPAGSELWP